MVGLYSAREAKTPRSRRSSAITASAVAKAAPDAAPATEARSGIPRSVVNATPSATATRLTAAIAATRAAAREIGASLFQRSCRTYATAAEIGERASAGMRMRATPVPRDVEKASPTATAARKGPMSSPPTSPRSVTRRCPRAFTNRTSTMTTNSNSPPANRIETPDRAALVYGAAECSAIAKTRPRASKACPSRGRRSNIRTSSGSRKASSTNVTDIMHIDSSLIGTSARDV